MINNHLIALLVAYFIVCLGYALFSMKTTRSHLFRGVSLLYLMVSISLALYFYNQLLSLPKPIDQEYFNNAKEALVLAVRPKNDQEIYLWLQLPDRDYPNYYVMPWSGRAAQELEIAQREAKEQEGSVLMKLPFKQSQMQGMKGDKKDRVFYPAPPPRPALKDSERDAAPSAINFPQAPNR